MNEHDRSEAAIIGRRMPHWLAQGYEVVRRPSGASLPPFLMDNAPDALLLGRSPRVAVQIIRKGDPEAERRTRTIQKLLQGHDDWRLEVLYTGPAPETLPAATAEALVDELAHVRRLARTEPRGSLLLAWSVLEAAARLLEPDEAAAVQSAGRVVELLAGSGHVTPTDAEVLRRFMTLRNRVAHGDLSARPTADQVSELASIIDVLVSELRPPAVHG